jgi:peptidoglycan/LPS O-acetylase OafA/YrhL
MGTVRFLLALCVVGGHSPGGAILGVTLLTGITAVQCFYVISGFLITMILNERAEYSSLRNFYLSRYLRLWPTYVVIALLSLVLFKRDVMFSELPKIASLPTMTFIAFSNLMLFFQDWFLFLRLDGGYLVPTAAFADWPSPQLYTFLLVPQCWTLGVELTFYAMAPFICRRWRLVGLLFIFGAASRLIVASYSPTIDPWIYRFAPAEMMMFAAGGLAYFAGRSVCPLFPLATRRVCSAAMIAFAVVIVGNKMVGPWIGHHFRDMSSTLLLLNWPILILIVLAVAPLFYGTRNNRIDRWLGELSYPLYVCHLLVAELLARYMPAWSTAGNALYVASSIGLSAILVFAIIDPIDQVRRNLGARSLKANWAADPAIDARH